ncbi:hypothetical protein [Arthrobacter sp. A5]|uniref:hypothetical protein n=1 Tax=Arthrobacter sp. A5 TaxID=576926 RepID=UPI003DA8FE01
MSTPYESPDPEHSGGQPPAAGRDSRPASDAAPESGSGYEQQAPPGYQQPGYQQPGYQQPGYQQPGYQQPPPAYQQRAAGQQGGYLQRPKSPAANFSHFPERLRDLTAVPREVKNAYLLFVAGALLNLLASLVSLILVGSRSGAFVVGFAVIGFVFAIIFTAVFIWLALLMKEGVGWARVVLIILAALNIIGGLFSLIGMFASAVSLINLLSSVAIVIGGILLLLPPAQAYFKARRPQGYLQ